ncbi:MAG: hypothetical protein ACI8TX_000320, partial [Hyphomicrobiaceae bacterium]
TTTIVPVTTTTIALVTTTTMPPQPCGDFDGDGEILAGDALGILRVAVGIGDPCPLSVCDVDGGGRVLATDALRTLQIAVGRDIPLLCPGL